MNNQIFECKSISLYDASLSPLSKKDETNLAKQAAAGNKKAREILIRANIRYALSYAKTFYGYGLSNDEVDVEAVIGLIKAVDHYDFSKGTKVITLAKMYIMNEIVSARNKSGFIQRQSDERLRMILKLNKAMKKMNTDCSQSELIEKLSVKTGFDRKVVSDIFEETQPCISLDEKTSNDSHETRLSAIPDTTDYTPEETAVYHIQKQALYENLEKLEPIEKQIICMLYGLKQYKKPYSLSEIGEELGKSKQYIHYIKQRTLDKLRTNMGAIAA
ncbi:MAG: sigma-70 family RNA polymerase sigma factor [Treponemataceae bacterium]|nr:sigma-70 family RNA polymerase sigma factor [Treponemataceae bacterium]